MRYTFKTTDRLKSTKSITAVYKDGVTGFCHPFRYAFLHEKSDTPVNDPCQIMIAVPKRRFPLAIHRNLLRRRIREAYRINKHLLHHTLAENNLTMALVITYVATTLDAYSAIERKLIVLLRQIATEVSKP